MGETKAEQADPPAPPGSEVRTLREAAELFFAQPTSKTLAANALASWGVRALLGPPRITEIPVALATVAWWPVQEWLAHRYLLHLRPRTILGRKIDPEFARAHRKHHREPTDALGGLVPMEVIKVALPANILFWLVAGGGSARRTATGIATYATMALIYDWTHFLVHTSYRPRGRLFRRIRRNHRLHHFYNENNWFSFVWPGVDRAFGTEPNPRDIERSSTARDLHGEVFSGAATQAEI